MTDWLLDLTGPLGIALLAGSAIGLERNFHGRAAGFRTHALVCVASALLMLLPLTQAGWMPEGLDLQVDPGRIAQGIMTGVGFIGAGAILQEGLSIRGLTTAASIWITAAIGIVAGVGLYDAAIVATVVTLVVLTLFRWIEGRLPIEHRLRVVVRFVADGGLRPEALAADLRGAGFDARETRNLVDHAQQLHEVEFAVHSRRRHVERHLAHRLESTAGIARFEITPASL